MKKLIALFLLGLACGALSAQPVVVQTQNGTGLGISGAHNQTYSAYGYPWFALAGSTRSMDVRPYAEIDTVTGWTGNGTTVTFTANNHLVTGAVVSLLNFTHGSFNWNIYQVTGATSTTFSIADGTTGTFSESTALAYVTQNTGFTGNGTWTITTTTACGGGGQPACETYRLFAQDDSGGDTGFVTSPSLTTGQTVNFTVGPTPGLMSTTGSITTSNFAIHSTVEFDLTFTSADDPTKTGTYHYVVAENGGGYPYAGVVHAQPGYRQIFKNRVVPLAGQVFGNTNQMIDWTITAAPGGGDASIDFATFPQPVFHSGTVSGSYEITACPAVDHTAGACDKIGIWVSPNDPPAGNADKAEQVPCDIDTYANPPNVYDIHPITGSYHNLLAVPQTFAGPILIRVFNDGANGSPTVYHNQLQINPPASGTWDHRHPAITLCGVPNPTTGELPIVDGDNSTTNSWTSPYLVAPYSLIATSGNTLGPTYNNGTVKPLNHITYSGIHIRNVGPGYHYYDQSGTLQAWGSGYGFKPIGVQYYTAIGNYADHVTLPFFDDCNAQSGWAQCSLDVFYEGNHGIDYGTNGQSTEHFIYSQSFRSYSALNIMEGGVAGDQGTAYFSDRGTRSFRMYNRGVPASGRSTAANMGGHSEIQDAYNYILPDEYFGYQGAASCATTYATAPECAGSFGGAAWYAAVQEEHANTDFTIGNFYSLDSAGGAKMYSLSTTHNTTGVDNSVRGYFAYNTIVASTAQITDGGAWFEDTRSQAFGSTDLLWTPAVYPKGIFVNNILPGKDNTSCAYSCLTTQADGHAHVTYQTNMLPTNMVTPASNIQPTGWASGGIFHNGVNTSYQFFDPSTIKPINRFLHGLTSPNFIAWTVFPVNTTTGLPVSGSQAIGQASALTDELTYYPPRFNPVTANMDAFTLRADLTTLGANDPTGPLAPSVTTTAASSITTTTATAGGNVTSDGGNAVTSRGTCYSTSANPTSPCTSDGTGTGAFTSSLTGLTASTTYHIRAFATNGIGTSYGSDLTFTTSGVPTAPTVTTSAASSITDTTAATGGNVTADGGASVTSRGVCYSTSSNPTSPCTSNGTGTGVFSSSLSGLTASTLYHIRAFATNSVGTSYGSDLTFTTSAPSNSVTFGGNVSFSGSVAIQQ